MAAKDAKELSETNKEVFIENRFKARVHYIDEGIYKAAYQGFKSASFSWTIKDTSLNEKIKQHYQELGYQVCAEQESILISWDTNEFSNLTYGMDRTIIPPDESIATPPKDNTKQKRSWWQKIKEL